MLSVFIMLLQKIAARRMNLRVNILGTGLSVQLETASPAEFPAKVARPRYSVLQNRSLKTHGLNVFEPWQAGLHNHLRQAFEAYVTYLR
jgi:dTDP-4-dehydrorhamnose reductase